MWRLQKHLHLSVLCRFSTYTTRKKSTFYVLGGHTTPGQMSGILHRWQRNKSDMCWTIHSLQCVINPFYSEPRSTFTFSHGALFCLSAYAVEIKIQHCLLTVIFVTLWCACFSAFRSETWSAYSECDDILSVEHVRADKELFNTDTLHRLIIKHHSSQVLPYQFQPWQKTAFVIYCHYGLLSNSFTSSLSLVYFLLCKQETWKHYKKFYLEGNAWDGVTLFSAVTCNGIQLLVFYSECFLTCYIHQRYKAIWSL